jgi:ferritin-like metal-binding protein YciE
MSKVDKQINQTIADWLGDLVALESHVEEAMDRQLDLKSDNPALSAGIQRFHDTVRDSKHRAEAYQQQYGSTAGNPIIKAGSAVLGKAAGMIDKMRDDSVSKALRDDYTAYNHVAVAYTMLHTTAMALGDNATGQFAEEGVRTYARMVQDLNHLIPEAVVQDLRHEEGAQIVDTDVVAAVQAMIDNAWKSTAAH